MGISTNLIKLTFTNVAVKVVGRLVEMTKEIHDLFRQVHQSCQLPWIKGHNWTLKTTHFGRGETQYYRVDVATVFHTSSLAFYQLITKCLGIIGTHSSFETKYR